MTQADSVHSTPPLNTSSETIVELPQRVAGERLAQLAAQERQAEKTRQRVRKLREKAFGEIERLIAFLDASDGYTMDEREVNGDEADASYPEGCLRLSDHPNEDDEDNGDGEPSLAAPEDIYGAKGQTFWAQGNESDLEDEHDGAEPDHDGDGDPDNEPCLGWPEANGIGGAGWGGSDDREAQDHNSVQPQHRTVIDREPITVECSYRKFVSGLTDSQRAGIR